jgi:regulator of sigma E protease
MKVDEFGFGFPPRLLGIQKDQGRWKIVWGHKQPANTDATIYSINWIVLGGFVKIVGENNENADDPRSFINKPFWARLKTLVAGVAMNVILAWLLLSAGYVAGLPVAIDDPSSLGNRGQLTDRQVAIVNVLPDSPAAKAGVQPSDVIITIDGIAFSDVTGLQQYIRDRKGQAFDFTVRRINETKQLTVQSEADPAENSGPTGIALATYGKLSFPWYTALWEGAKTTVYQLYGIVYGLFQLFSQGAGLENLGGPVKIAQLTGQVADLGLVSLMQFTAFLSLNLAILNILPLPALDGGRVLFLIIEKIRGRRNNQSIEQWANTVGFLLLLTLMAVITARDILGIVS